MLSILIPIYNFDVRRLVSELDRQAALLDVSCEICCLDDASEISFSTKEQGVRSQLAHVRYEELSREHRPGPHSQSIIRQGTV
jgi:hypothetical protein